MTFHGVCYMYHGTGPTCMLVNSFGMLYVHSLHLVTPALHLDPDNKVMDPRYLQGVPGPLIPQ